MIKKSNFEEGQIKHLDQQTETQTPNQKRHSKAYYKLLHTYNTLISQSKSQPISIHNCATPIIAQRLFGCKLNQKPQLNEQIIRFLKEKQMQRNFASNVMKNQQMQKNQFIADSVNQDDEDDGFQIGEKDELDEVMQMGKKLVGGWMKGFLPGINLSKK